MTLTMAEFCQSCAFNVGFKVRAATKRHVVQGEVRTVVPLCLGCAERVQEMDPEEAEHFVGRPFPDGVLEVLFDPND